MPVPNSSESGLADPAVGVGETHDELGVVESGKVGGMDGPRSARTKPINPAVGGVHVSFMIPIVIHLLVIPVTDVEGAIGSDL